MGLAEAWAPHLTPAVRRHCQSRTHPARRRVPFTALNLRIILPRVAEMAWEARRAFTLAHLDWLSRRSERQPFKAGYCIVPIINGAVLLVKPVLFAAIATREL